MDEERDWLDRLEAALTKAGREGKSLSDVAGSLPEAPKRSAAEVCGLHGPNQMCSVCEPERCSGLSFAVWRPEFFGGKG